MINKYKHIVYVLFVSVFALGYGQSTQELQRLRSDYEKFQRDQNQLAIPKGVDQEFKPGTGLPREAQITSYQPMAVDEIMEDEGLKHFGYDFFTRRDEVAFWENLPTPANYLLGSGDELVISLWGETQIREKYTITRDGKIYDGKVGLLTLTGKSMGEARQYLKDQFARVYATLKGKNATTFIDVSLGELRSINVNFVGQIKYPGVYPIHPFSTVITGLIQAGGVDTTGSLRQIQVKRDGSTEETIDLYNYLISGEVSSNIQLRDQDIVVIPPRTSVVEIDSAVVSPGIYESIPGETIYDMIHYAGGRKQDASETVGIHKIKPKSERTNGIIYEAYYLDFESTKLIPAANVDQISVRHLFHEVQQVEIIGQVKVPGQYHYYEGMTFKNLLKLSGGLEDSTYTKSVYLEKAEIIRRNPGSRYDEVISVKLGKILNNDTEKKIVLHNLDRVVVHANSNFFEKEHVQILGEVNIPGSYPLISDNETLQSVLNRAGNFTSNAMKNGIAIYRDRKYFEVTTSQATLLSDGTDGTDGTDGKVRVAWQNVSVTLMPGDSVVVKESPGTVNVSGKVYNPGLIEFRKEKGLKYYISGAGGVTEQGNKKSIIVIYANGVVSPKKWYSTPKIEDGATIIVNEKQQSEPFDPTVFASTLASFLSSIVTIMVLSKQL